MEQQHPDQAELLWKQQSSHHYPDDEPHALQPDRVEEAPREGENGFRSQGFRHDHCRGGIGACDKPAFTD